MTYDPIADAWASYELARYFKRLAHVASGKDFWRDCQELYAAESGPLFSFVSGVKR